MYFLELILKEHSMMMTMLLEQMNVLVMMNEQVIMNVVEYN